AARYLEQAGDQARGQSAHAAAEDCYRESLTRFDRMGQVLAAAAVREKLGAVLAAVGRYDEALAELERAVRIYGEAGHRSGVYRATAQIGWVHFKRGTSQEGLTRVQPLLESCAGSKVAAASAETAERAPAPVPPRDVA